MSRWEQLLESKPVPIVEQLKDEVAKLLAKELSSWPPPTSEMDASYANKFADLFAGSRPTERVFAESFQLARWELEREIEIVDEYMRNQRFVDKGLQPTDKPALLFLSRWLTEQMLGLKEATQSRLKRADLIDCLERTERRMGLKSVLLA